MRISKRYLCIAVSAAALLLIPRPAHALFELKGGFTALVSSPSALNTYVGSSGPQVGTQQGLTVDALVKPIGLPFGLGVRYEAFSQKSGDGTTATGGMESTFTRMSVIVNHRFIDTGVYVGPILTVGVTNDLEYKLTRLSALTTYKTGGQINGSIGVEGGFKLGVLRLGAELGYLYGPLGRLKTKGGPDVIFNGSTVDVDYSGPYARVIAGFGF